MPAAALRQQLNDHVGHMYATGILDEYYQQLQLTQDEVINIFFHDADRMLNDITSLLSVPPRTSPSALLIPIVLGIDFVSSA
uniref:Uncharacterized protein n=1 Tax=Aegilops tauschii TaxID=37682 RepID=R7WER0_AEGTA